jgi:hypothetical protein
MISLRGPVGTLLAGFVLMGCSATTHTVHSPHDFMPRDVVEVDRYEVRSGSKQLAMLVQLEIRDPNGPLRFWRVVTPDGSWVGHVTEQGRFSRRVPFRSDEEDLGIWPMAQGVARLLSVDGSVQLHPVPVAAPASARTNH